MRQLNKIVFINSANIPYAEVMLDGNVHFSGTQGVGKSTVLRALLFFYNADKQKLGIQSGQKSFDEFYLPHANSYIVYEVATEQGAFSILLSRSGGKMVYRFIDAPYRREWLVDIDGRAENDWIRIRERIGERIGISAKVDSFQQYRNIIYGNTHDSSHRYDRYALVESTRYQNIPRSIQNVFLNSKLDADFIKNTIIQSMTDSEDKIILSNYRSWLTDFARQYEEIECWFKKNSAGQVVVRNKANKVIDTYRILIALDSEMRQVWRQLNYAVEDSRSQLPILNDRIEEFKQQIARIKEKTANARSDYDKEHDTITAKIAIANTKLKEIRERRKHYEDIHIDEIMDLDAREPIVKSDLSQKQRLLDSLQSMYSDLADKYRKIYEELDSSLEKFDLKQGQQLNMLTADVHVEDNKASSLRDKRKADAERAYNEWLADSDTRMSELNDACALCKSRLSEVRHFQPLKPEIDDCDKRLRTLKAEESKSKLQLENIRDKLQAIQRETDLKSEQIEWTYRDSVERVAKRIEELKERLADTESFLDAYKDSLYEWLVENVPGWEENIGKVADERSVLYGRGLEPRMSEGSTLFGIEINLDAIPLSHHSPDEYRRRKKQLTNEIGAENDKLRELDKNRSKEFESLNKEFKSRTADLRTEEVVLQNRIDAIPKEIKDTETERRKIVERQNTLVEREHQKRNDEYNEAKLSLEREKEARKEQADKSDKAKRAADSSYKANYKMLLARIEGLKKQQEEARRKKLEEIATRRREVEDQERAELKGKGADTTAIDSCRREISELEKILAKIDSQRRHVIEYRKDENELFSHEQEYQDTKRRYQDKDERLKKKFDDQCRRLAKELSEKEDQLDGLKQRSKDLDDGITQYERLCGENTIPSAVVNDETLLKNSFACIELVSRMRKVIHEKSIRFDELKRSVNSFNSHFRPNNSFHLIFPQLDEDYLPFAANLLEFVEENKIEDIRIRVTDHYHSILENITREVGMIMNRTSEISKIINDINRDFKERNFAGVIRSIELRANNSTDRMMSLLRDIRDFTEENRQSIGETNLFSEGDNQKVNDKVVDYIRDFSALLQKESSRTELTLSDTFNLEFRIIENDNDTGWVERINNVGSDGTDILVKAMVNIMLINVFKTRASRRSGEFIIHCMMDEIGKLHPSNVEGILKFANVRNIYLLNSSPMGYNADIYRYNYLLTKDSASKTRIKRLLTVNVS